MSALAWWVTAGSGALLVSVLAALGMAQFIGFADTTPDDEGQR